MNGSDAELDAVRRRCRPAAANTLAIAAALK